MLDLVANGSLGSLDLLDSANSKDLAMISSLKTQERRQKWGMFLDEDAIKIEIRYSWIPIFLDDLIW